MLMLGWNSGAMGSSAAPKLRDPGSGYCLHGILQVLAVLVCIYLRFSGFLPPSERMQVGGLAEFDKKIVSNLKAF